MRIGIPSEIKADERRVSMTPAGAHAAAAQRSKVLVETGAGVAVCARGQTYAIPKRSVRASAIGEPLALDGGPPDLTAW